MSHWSGQRARQPHGHGGTLAVLVAGTWAAHAGNTHVLKVSANTHTTNQNKNGLVRGAHGAPSDPADTQNTPMSRVSAAGPPLITVRRHRHDEQVHIRGKHGSRPVPTRLPESAEMSLTNRILHLHQQPLQHGRTCQPTAEEHPPAAARPRRLKG